MGSMRGGMILRGGKHLYRRSDMKNQQKKNDLA